MHKHIKYRKGQNRYKHTKGLQLYIDITENLEHK